MGCLLFIAQKKISQAFIVYIVLLRIFAPNCKVEFTIEGI